MSQDDSNKKKKTAVHPCYRTGAPNQYQQPPSSSQGDDDDSRDGPKPIGQLREKPWLRKEEPTPSQDGDVKETKANDASEVTASKQE